MYTLQFDTEGARGEAAHEMAYVIRQKDTNNCVTFGEWAKNGNLSEFVANMAEDILHFGIRHINMWGKTDYNSLWHTLDKKARDAYHEAWSSYPNYEKSELADLTEKVKWHDATVYCQHILYTDDDLLNEYLIFNGFRATGMCKLENLARFVYNNPRYRQTHHALEDCYDAQSVHLFFAQHDLANSIRWEGSFEMSRA